MNDINKPFRKSLNRDVGSECIEKVYVKTYLLKKAALC